MDNLLLYLLKVTSITTLFYVSYLFFFSKDTFYKRNRIILILILLVPTILPALKIPVLSTSAAPTETSYAMDNIAFSGNTITTLTQGTINSFDYTRLFVLIYFTITVLILLRAAISIISTFRIIKKGAVKTNQFPKVIISDIPVPPFSFFSYAVIPLEDYKSGNYDDILDHEFAHIRQGHTFDLLISELFIAFQWFNPFVWFIKRSIILNHEYLADHASLSNKSVKEYQYRLLNFRLGLKNISLAHNFNSLIKNRIIMINKKPTRKYGKMKNILILPIVALVAYAFATPTYRHTPSGDNSRNINISSILIDGTVKGIILDQDGSPLPGTNIVVSGTTIGTSADLKGQFTLVNVSDKSSLDFSFVGYKHIRLNADFSKEMIVRMVRSTLVIESVVITPGTKTESINSDNVNPSTPENAKTDAKKVVPEGVKKENVFILIEEMPTFKGGSPSLMKWISDHTKYPAEAVRNKISGDVVISFVVKSTGKIGSVKVVNSLNPILDAEAIRVISSLPDWKPGKQNGKTVDIDYILPFTFSLTGKESLFSKTSMSEFYKFIYMNISYPQEAKNSSDTGRIFVVVKLDKGGITKECKSFTDRKEVKVPLLEEVVITGYKSTSEKSSTNSFKAVSTDHHSLSAECLRVANKLTANEIPDWKDKDMEFALAFKFILK